MNETLEGVQLICRKPFGNISMGVFRNSVDECCLTRRQIGEALEYKNPNEAIQLIHSRNRDRLDRFSTPIKVYGVEGNRTVMRESIVYNLKGCLEIIRFSRQPRADAFMDWVWDLVIACFKNELVPAVNINEQAIDMSQFVPIEAHQALVSRVNELEVAVNELKRLSHSNPESPKPKRLSDGFAEFIQKVNENEKAVQSPRPLKSLQSHDSKAQSPWRHKVYELAKPTCRRLDVPVSTLFSRIYHKMQKDYGWVFSEERKAYIAHNGEIPNTSVIDIVEDSPSYRDIFMSILKDMYEDAKPAAPVQKLLPSPVDVANAVMNKEPVVNEAPIAPVEIHSQSSIKANPQHDFVTASKQAIEKLATKRGDTSYHSTATYHEVYKALGKDGMNLIRSSYMRSYGKPKGAVINMFNTKNRYDKLLRAISQVAASV